MPFMQVISIVIVKSKIFDSPKHQHLIALPVNSQNIPTPKKYGE